MNSSSVSSFDITDSPDTESTSTSSSSLKALFHEYHLDKDLQQFIDLGLKTIEDLDLYKDMSFDELVKEENVKTVFGQRFFDKKRFHKLINEQQFDKSTITNRKSTITKVKVENENNENINPQVVDLSNNTPAKKQKIWDYDPKYFKRPSVTEKEELAANNWKNLITEVGWIKTTSNLCKGQDVLIPKYIPRKQIEEIRTRNSSDILRKNFHYFLVSDKEAIFRYIDRYGIEYRQFEIKEIWDHIRYHGWKWIKAKKKWNLQCDYIYLRDGVEIQDTLEPLKLNVDYFLDAESIADYFLTVLDDDKIPVVGEIGIYEEYKKILQEKTSR